MNIDEIVKVYVKIRDAKAKIKKEADTQCADLQSKMDRLAAEIQREMQRLNLSSVRTESGTAFQKEEIKPSCKDWEVLDVWAEAEGVPPSEVYEKRLSKKFVTDYMASHDGAPPPPVSVYREFVVHVRRGD